MTVFLFANNATTTLAGPIAANATSVTLAAGTGALFPVPAVGQLFALTFTSQANQNLREISYCTGRSGDVCTVVRGQEGTTALAFIAGDNAANYLTAATTAAFTQASQLQAQSGDYGVDTGTVNNIVVTLNPAPASLVSITGAPIRVLIKNTNTGPSTLTITGLATTTIQNPNGAALISGQVVAGEIAEFKYVGGVGYQLSNTVGVGGVLSGQMPSPGMAAGAAAANVGTLGGFLTGTLPNPGSTLNPTFTTVTTTGGIDCQGTLTVSPGGAQIATGALGSSFAGSAVILNDFSHATSGVNNLWMQRPDGLIDFSFQVAIPVLAGLTVGNVGIPAPPSPITVPAFRVAPTTIQGTFLGLPGGTSSFGLAIASASQITVSINTTVNQTVTIAVRMQGF